MELRTGKVRWSEEQFRAGSVTLAGDRLLILRESGRARARRRVPRRLPAAGARAGAARGRPRLPRARRRLPLRPQREHARQPRPAARRGTGALETARQPRAAARRGQAPADPRALLDRGGGGVRARPHRRIGGRVRRAGEGGARPSRLSSGSAASRCTTPAATSDCRRQFESHRTVNPDDVENAAWHFLCVARAESPERARAALLPVGPDSRVPMRQVYEMFRGKLDARAGAGRGRLAARAVSSTRNLYLGLVLRGDRRRARARASTSRWPRSERFAAAGGYMHMVARVHLARLK